MKHLYYHDDGSQKQPPECFDLDAEKVLAECARLERERDDAQARAESAVACLEQKPMKIKSIHWNAGEPGEVVVEHWAARALAASFAESLGDAPNYLAMNCGTDVERDGKIEHVTLEIVIRRVAGKTPAMMKDEAICDRDEARKVAHVLRNAALTGFIHASEKAVNDALATVAAWDKEGDR